MNKKKIGVILLVTVIGIAGMSVSYAMVTDGFKVQGFAPVVIDSFEVVDYSGTWVWKIWDVPLTTPPFYIGLDIDPDDEIAIYHGFYDENTQSEIEQLLTDWGCQHMFLSCAKSMPNDNPDTIYNVDMDFDNLFPCIDFTADFIVRYTGTEPMNIPLPSLTWDDTVGNFDFSDYTVMIAYEYSLVDGEWVKGNPIVDWPYEINNDEYVGFEIIIHLDQDNDLQNKHGEFVLEIN